MMVRVFRVFDLQLTISKGLQRVARKKSGRKPGRPRKIVKPKSNIDNDARTAIKQAVKPLKRPSEHLVKHHFPPGKSGNPEGRKPDPFSKKVLRAYTEQDFKDLLDILVEQDYDTLKDVAKIRKDGDKDGEKNEHSIIKVMAARVAMKIMATGSAKDFETFLNRLIGKPKTIVQISGDVNNPIGVPLNASVVITIPSNGKEANS